MSVLCERPDSEFFCTIPDLHEAVHSFAENEVSSKIALLGSIFVKHGVTREFGLAMVHRHFGISKNEVLVETLNDQKSVSVTSPWIIKGMQIFVIDTKSIVIEKKKKSGKLHRLKNTTTFCSLLNNLISCKIGFFVHYL